MTTHPCAESIKRHGYCVHDRPCGDCEDARQESVKLVINAADHAMRKCDCIEPEDCPVCDGLSLAITIMKETHKMYGGLS